ncbi:MAG: efflux RND transporter permease subunit [Pseudomonadota bacterium]
MLKRLEDLVFKLRIPFLLALTVLTLVTGYYAAQLRFDAGFIKQLPTDHPFIETFQAYRDKLPPPNTIIIGVHPREGTVWTVDALRKVNEVTDAVFFLPGVYRGSVQSLWTPNTRVLEVNEDGLLAYNVIEADVTPKNIDDKKIDRIRDNTLRGGHVGQLVSHDFTIASVKANLNEVDNKTKKPLDYIDLARRLETDIRDRFEDDKYEIHIVGFAKMIGDIAEEAKNVGIFFLLAFVLTTLAVYAYARSVVLTLLAVFCSLVSVVWQFGLLKLFDIGLDPLAILVPFLVYAIGVSHGVQQINLMSAEICAGRDSETAARATFSRLLVPGIMALVTALVGFLTLYLIPIPMIQEMSMMASIGVALKIITNLFMLPVVASYCKFGPAYVARITRARAVRAKAMRWLAGVAQPRASAITLIIGVIIFAVSIAATRDRHVGDLHAGAPELWPEERYNVDTNLMVEKFSMNLDAFIIIGEMPELSCIDYPAMDLLDRFSWHLQNTQGVKYAMSLATLAKLGHSVWSEDNLKFRALARNPKTFSLTIGGVPLSSGLLNENCTMLPIIAFTLDHKATTINRVVAAAQQFIADNPMEGVRFRLASGNVGIMAATNEVIAENEVPMLIAVYIAIIALVILAYRDWRATICCCVPLILATFIGYWFMSWQEIGLKVSTLPVLVLAVGIGVDYAFYIYSRMQGYLENGMDVADAYAQALQETGMAVMFTGATLCIGVSTWAFSALKFQADMGILLSFMFLINMIGAVSILPALAVTLERWFPRRRKAAAAA